MKKPVTKNDYISTLRECLLPKGSKAIMFGDGIIDNFVNVINVKKSPESPILALEANEREQSSWAGGALNVENIMRELGMKVQSFIDQVIPKSMKLRYMYNGQCITRVDYDRIIHKDWRQQSKTMSKSFKSMRGHHNVVIQDYGKGAINETFYSWITPLIIDNRFYVLFGPHITTEPNRAVWPYLVKMNQDEFSKFGPRAEDVVQRFHVQKYLVVTGHPITRLYVVGGYNNIRCIEIENSVHEEILSPNIIGAGDIVMGILGCLDYSKIQEYDLAAMLKIAMGVATVKCMRPYLGGSVLDMFNVFYKKYVSQLMGRPIYISQDKTFNEIVDLEKRMGRSVIFINGSFDILHAGHMSLFSEAHRIKEVECYNDASIFIAINTDEDIKERKGKESINTTEKRLLQISPFADYTMSFYSEKTLECIVKRLKPDVMLKGSDYECKKITGSRYCKSIRFVPHTGDSSSEIRKKVGK
jgi:D-beta-D-heptose 7-phosphate kinase/D-beta-D-heptose 1-phosphate adenosyltransferase